MNSFLEFEEKNKMFKVKINNVYIWSYLRFTVFNDLLEKNGYLHSVQNNIQNIKSDYSLEFWCKKYISCYATNGIGY